MQLQFINYWAFLFLLFLPFLFYGFWQLEKKKKSINQLFFQQKKIFPSWVKTKFFLELACLVFLILAIARLQGNPKRITSSQTGRDVVFLLDISKSMLANDVLPSRLTRAKELITSVLRELELQGDRVSLVVFAGNSVIKSPLTLDYNYFRKILRMANPNDLAKGGTQLEQAIRVVTDRVLRSDQSLYQDVILLTDGESKEDDPLAAAKIAADKKVNIYTVGIGSPNGVRLIDRSGKAIAFQGEPVISRLDEKTLKEIAKITRSAYFPVHTKQADLGVFYKRFIQGKSKRLVEDTETIVWEEYYQYFLFLALGCILLWNVLLVVRSKKT